MTENFNFSVDPKDAEDLTLDQRFAILDNVLPALGLTIQDVSAWLFDRMGWECEPLAQSFDWGNITID